MKALVYHGPGQKAWQEVPDPTIVDPTDVIVAVDTTTICGTDLHILKGDVPAVTDGRILGHEGVGTITEVGQAVSTLAVGDRVIISCITSCGSCSYCHQQLPAHCLDDEGASGIGWILGHLIDGTQAEYVRVPFAESSLHRLPEGVSDEAAVMLSDILPTGFEIGVRNGRVKPGDVVAVVGAGPVGLAAMMTAGLYGASRIIAIDLDDNRVQQAKGFGATDGVNSGAAGWKDEVLAMTDAAWAWTSRSRRWGCRRPSRWPPSSSGPAARWRTSACTDVGGAANCRTCGSRTWRSPPAWSAPRRRRCCSNSSPRASSPRRSSSATTSVSTHHRRLRHLRPRRGNKGPQGRHHPLTSDSRPEALGPTPGPKIGPQSVRKWTRLSLDAPRELV